MPHFLDMLVAHKFPPDPRDDDLLAELSHSECILADNAFDFFLEHSGYCNTPPPGPATQPFQIDHNKLTSALGSIVPPFAATFVTTQKPEFIGGVQMGVLLIRRQTLATQPQCFVDGLRVNDEWKSRLHLYKLGVHWLVYAVPLTCTNGMIQPPHVIEIVPLREDGHLYLGTVGGTRFVMDDNCPTCRLQAELLGLYMSMIGFSFTLIHSRHTQMIEHDPTPTRALRRQSERRKEKTGCGLIRFHTLQIDAIKRILETEGRIREVGLLKALHLVRGHFKDYTKGKGLFGKYPVRFWVNEHQRGSLSEGAILKDYIAPPSIGHTT